jgi:hypothetical protein
VLDRIKKIAGEINQCYIDPQCPCKTENPGETAYVVRDRLGSIAGHLPWFRSPLPDPRNPFSRNPIFGEMK